MARLLVSVISFTVRILRAAFRSRADLVIENVALRQQVATLLKQRHPGRPRIDATIRDLIREMATDGWGAPRIHGELMELGLEVSEATVSLSDGLAAAGENCSIM